MSGKIDSAESMFEGIKPYEELDSIHKIARKASMKIKCKDCSYEGLCPNKVVVVCIKSFEKGFVNGVKYHRKSVKKIKDNPKRSTALKITGEEIRQRLLNYFKKEFGYGYFNGLAVSDIIEYLSGKL